MSSSPSKTKWRLLIGSLPMLQAYVRRLSDSDEQPEDLLQEVSVRLLSSDSPDDPARYAVWARGVVRHVVAHDWRMRRRARAEQPFDEETTEALGAPPAEPEAHLDARAWVERIIDDLDSDGVELLYRRYVLQESGKELANDRASSPAAMRMRLMRLRSSVSALVRGAREALTVAATLMTATADFPIA